MDKLRRVLGLYRAVLQHLRAAGDDLQGRFQLVGHICGELPAHPLSLRLLGHIESQQDRSGRRSVSLYAAQVKLVLPAVPLHSELAVPLPGSLFQRRADGMAVVNKQEILPQAGAVRMENSLCRRVHADDFAVPVQQDQPLVHVGGYLHELIGPLFQALHLLRYLQPLAVYLFEQRGQLLIGLVLKRPVQVQPVQRPDNALCKPMGQQGRKHHSQYAHNRHGLEHGHHQGEHGSPADGNPQHRAVAQLAGPVEGLLGHGAGKAGALALAAQKRLLYFLPVSVIAQLSIVLSRVEEHRPIRGDPCQAVAFAVYALKIVPSAFLNPLGRKVQLVRQLAFLNVPVVLV